MTEHYLHVQDGIRQEAIRKFANAFPVDGQPPDDPESDKRRIIQCLRHDVMPFIIDDKKRSRYLEGIRDWNRFRRKFINLATELQERYAAQIDLQKMFASNKAMNNAEYFEEVEDEDEEVDG